MNISAQLHTMSDMPGMNNASRICGADICTCVSFDSSPGWDDSVSPVPMGGRGVLRLRATSGDVNRSLAVVLLGRGGPLSDFFERFNCFQLKE